jgi:hypothetical protein
MLTQAISAPARRIGAFITAIAKAKQIGGRGWLSGLCGGAVPLRAGSSTETANGWSPHPLFVESP